MAQETEDALAQAINTPEHQKALSTWTNALINDWLTQTRGLPVTLQLTKLGFHTIIALEVAYKAGFRAGRK